jgi:phospholipid/cholesterol/gamma-HCH transport system substrate-binding protein
MRVKEKTNIIKVGIFLSILIIVLMIFVVSIGKENSLFDPKIEIRAVVKSASNLKPGAFVELKGIRVGEVDEVNIIEDDAVEILFKINSKSLRWIKADSKINISTAGLVGDKFLEITGGSKEARQLKPHKDVLYSDEAVDFKKFMNKGENIADTLGRVLARFENILANIDDGKTITDTLVHMKEVSASLQSITKEIEKAKLGETMKNFSQTTKRIDRISARIEEGPGTFNSLIYDDGVHDDLRALLGGAERNKVLKYFIRESIKNNKTKPKDP